MTLIIQLDLDFLKDNPHTKFRDPRSNGLVCEIETYTDGTDFIPSTTNVVGEKFFFDLIQYSSTSENCVNLI